VSGTVLVLRALGLGDLLAGVPALRAIADAFPGHRRVLACPLSLEPLARLTGAVDEVVRAAAFTPLPESVEHADVAVNLHGSGPQSHRMLLAAKPRRLIAYRNDEAGVDGPAFDERDHEVVRWCRLLDEHGICADPTELRLAAPDLGLPADVRGATIIHPGAASPSRRWPEDRFAAVARAEVARGRRVLITGGASEVVLACRVGRLAGLRPDDIWAGRTDLVQLASLVAEAGRVVSGDTGVAHLATAVGTPSVILFGPTSPDRWGPPPELRARHRVLWTGGRGNPHARTPDPGLLEIDVADVLLELGALDELPTTAAPHPDRVPLLH
jgi:ADP-heptose:LPS heptosyltransferase